MKKAATQPEAGRRFRESYIERPQADRTAEAGFELLGKPRRPRSAKPWKDLFEAGMIEDTERLLRGMQFILAAQKAEHYEIASYGTLKVFAEMMGETEIARELGMILKEEVSPTRCSRVWPKRMWNEMAVAE